MYKKEIQLFSTCKETDTEGELTSSLDLAASWHSCSPRASAALTAALESSRAPFSAAYTKRGGSIHSGWQIPLPFDLNLVLVLRDWPFISINEALSH